MIDLLQSALASPLIHSVPTDPGTMWTKDVDIAIDTPPDEALTDPPEALWPANAVWTGKSGAVAPRVVVLPGGGYRMFYTQILPRPGYSDGANDYNNATSRIQSAFSSDGRKWTREPGVRLSPLAGGAGEFRVVSGDIVPVTGAEGKLRMYYECCNGPQSSSNAIKTAVSDDEGLTWVVEPGDRLSRSNRNYVSPRIVFVDEMRCRLYCGERGRGIISALSGDGGLTFNEEPGIRIRPDGPYDAMTAFAPEIMRADNGYIMYHAGYSAQNHACILRATSDDGLVWRKHGDPIVAPGAAPWDAAKCSEMCLYRLPHQDGQVTRYRMVYEACDGTAPDERGVWRIAGASSE